MKFWWIFPWLVVALCFILIPMLIPKVPGSMSNLAMIEAQADSIARLNITADSLRAIDAYNVRQDSLLADQKQILIIRTIYRVDSTRHLPPIGAVDMFNEHTGGGAMLNTDSTVTTPLKNVIAADVLFVEYDASLELNRILTDRNNELKVRIGGLLQLDTTNQQTISVLTNQNNALTTDNKQKDKAIKEGTKALRREKVLRVVTVGGAIFIEVVTIILLI